MLLQLWKNNPNLFKGAVRNYDRNEDNLKFKDGISKRRKWKPRAVEIKYKPLMKEFLENSQKQGFLREEKLASRMSPIFSWWEG